MLSLSQIHQIETKYLNFTDDFILLKIFKCLERIKEYQNYEYNCGILFYLYGNVENLIFLKQYSQEIFEKYDQNGYYTQELNILFDINRKNEILDYYFIINYMGFMRLNIDPLLVFDFLNEIIYKGFEIVEKVEPVFTSGFFDTSPEFYGEQEIFNFHGKRAVRIAKKLFSEREKYENLFEMLMIYFGYERYLCDVFQKDPDKYNILEILRVSNGRMGFIRNYSSAIKTPLFNSRYDNAKQLLNEISKFSIDGEVFEFEGSEFACEKEKIIYLYRNRIISRHVFTDTEIIYQDYPLTDDDISHLKQLFYECFYSRDKNQIINLHREMAVKVIHARGGGTIAEWMAISLFDEKFMSWEQDPKKEPWSMAISSGIDFFIKNYPILFM